MSSRSRSGRAPLGHDDQRQQDRHHHGEAETESWAVTAWGEHFELFPEIDALVETRDRSKTDLEILRAFRLRDPRVFKINRGYLEWPMLNSAVRVDARAFLRGTRGANRGQDYTDAIRDMINKRRNQ